MRRRLGLLQIAFGLGLVLSCVLLATRGAVAQAPAALPLDLEWQAPSECPTADDVQAELARIASAATGEDLKPLAARVSVTLAGNQYTARLHTEHEGLTGERTLQAHDCNTLIRSVTLVLALAFGRGVELRDEASTAPPDATAPPSTAPPEPAPKPKETPAAKEPAAEDESPSTPSDLRLGLLLGGGAQLTLMPSVAPLLKAGAALELHQAFSVELRIDLLPATAKAIDNSATARFEALAGTALACANVSIAAFCGGARVAAIRARTRGLSNDDAATAPWYAAAIASSVSWPQDSAVQIGVEALLAISITRPLFQVTGLGQTHRVPLLAPELSAFLRFWP